MWLEWNVQGFLLLKHGDVLLYSYTFVFTVFPAKARESNFAVIAARES